MSKVKINKVESNEDRSLPVFAEFDMMLDRIRQRAHELFHERGASKGRDLDNWLDAEKEICWTASELNEDDDEFELKVALAGFDHDDISVTANPGELMVKAEQMSERKSDEKSTVHWSEFRDKSVYRRIELPTSIDVDKVEAKLKDGMLIVEAPKAKKAVSKATEQKKQARKIDVSTAA